MLFLLRMLVLSVLFVLTCVLGLLFCLLRPFNPDNSRVVGGLFAAPAMRVLGLKCDVPRAQILAQPRPAVVVVNHISNYDLYVFGQVVPERTATLGKKSLKWIPFFGQLYWLAGNVLIDRGNAVKAKQAMMTSTRTLQTQDTSIWVFAEGTRGHGKGLGPFKRGAFQMAINAQVPIVMLCANNYVRGMKLNRWHSGTVVIRALPPIPTAGLTMDDLPALMDRCHAEMKACIDELDRQAGTTA